MFKSLILFFVILLFSVNNAFSQKFAQVKSEGKYKWQPEWNNYVAGELRNQRKIFLNDDAVPHQDILQLCPRYFSATEDEKIAFWTLVVASIAYFESSFKPAAEFKEVKLNNIYSRGLLQLSYGDEANHPIPISTQKKNIEDPEINLRSGVIILGRQLKSRKRLFTPTHYYWSVLTKKKTPIINFFKKNSSEFKFCK